MNKDVYIVSVHYCSSDSEKSDIIEVFYNQDNAIKRFNEIIELEKSEPWIKDAGNQYPVEIDDGFEDFWSAVNNYSGETCYISWIKREIQDSDWPIRDEFVEAAIDEISNVFCVSRYAFLSLSQYIEHLLPRFLLIDILTYQGLTNNDICKIVNRNYATLTNARARVKDEYITNKLFRAKSKIVIDNLRNRFENSPYQFKYNIDI